ncbi:hypothetical protein SAMN02910353_01263 [Ruminococcus sp. YRD2003]|nr:hypothetical protein SAMN02910353_01263 [Ruminococcus flavefaciens]
MFVIGIYWIAVLTLYKSITSTYAEHTDWINCEFINCTFINSNLCCEGSQNQNCKFTDCNTMYFKA